MNMYYAVGGGHNSYVAMIAKAILSSPDNRLPLTDIYDFINDAFFQHRSFDDGKAWRNNIRHHLSVNDCFVKVGSRCGRSRGSLWTIHPACVEAFRRGDYRQRRWTMRRVRSRSDVAESEGRYELMTRTISPSDELYAHLVSSGVFAKLSYACFGSGLL